MSPEQSAEKNKSVCSSFWGDAAGNIGEGRLDELSLCTHKITAHSKMFYFLPQQKFSEQFIKPLLIAVGIFCPDTWATNRNSNQAVLWSLELGLIRTDMMIRPFFWQVFSLSDLITNCFIGSIYTDDKARRDASASGTIPGGLIHKISLLDAQQALTV